MVKTGGADWVLNHNHNLMVNLFEQGTELGSDIHADFRDVRLVPDHHSKVNIGIK